MRPRSFDRGNDYHSGRRTERRPASMRPRSFDRGNPTPRVQNHVCGRCFNEAAIFRSRKPAALREQTVSLKLASMRPRSFDRGNRGTRRRGQQGVPRFNEAAIFRSRKQRALQLFYFQRPSGAFASGLGAQSSDGVICPVEVLRTSLKTCHIFSCEWPRRFAGHRTSRGPHRVTNTGYSSNSPSSVLAKRRA